MNLKHNRNAVLALTLIILSACAARTTPIISPAVATTSLQWTVQFNGAVAKANRAVETTVEVVQHSNLITAAQARPIIVACGNVATTSESIRAITSKGTEASWNIDGPAIRNLLASAHLAVPVSANPTIDLTISTLNAALLLLTEEVK